MKKQTRSILEELNRLDLHRDKEKLIESTGNNLIESVINLFDKIQERYSPDEALELERRFIRLTFSEEYLISDDIILQEQT